MEEIKLSFGEDKKETDEKIDVINENLQKNNQKEKDYGLSSLSESEQKQILDFVKKIDILDSNSIITYGSPAQNKIAQFSEATLKTARTKDLGEVGELLSDLTVNIQGFDSDKDKGFFGKFLGKAKNEIEKMKAQYAEVEVNIDKITDLLQNHRRVMLKDIAMYDELYKTNLLYFKELNMYIIAGKEKLRILYDETIPEYKIKAEETNDELDAQKLRDLLDSVDRFEKKIFDLELSRQVSLQMGPQIRLLQNNDAQLADKIQSSIINAIPLWKNQLVISLGLANAKSALEAQQKVTDMTNSLLKKNSEMLKMGTLEIAKESEKSVISIETVKKVNQDLIATINGVLEIQQKGREQRQVAEVELQKAETELKNILIKGKQ